MTAEYRVDVRPVGDDALDQALAELGLAPDSPAAGADGTAQRGSSRARRMSIWFLVYGAALALIVFWPQPVDSGAGPLLRRVTDLIPVLTYERIEFGANILLFVPFGVGLSLLLHTRRYLVVPLGILTSASIETVQAVLLVDRTPSVLDVVANVAGACLGLVAVCAIEALRNAFSPRHVDDVNRAAAAPGR